MEAIIIDTETHDTEAPEVIELAWKMAGEMQGGYCFSARFKPTKQMAWGALATHHILPDELVGLDPSAVAPQAVPQADYWIGHNVDFDWEALGKPAGVKRICTLAMARARWPTLDSHKLGALVYYLDGASVATRMRVRGAHGAAADVDLCEIVLNAIIKEGFTSWSALHAYSEDCRIPKIMAFGKYKGQPISAVDRGWTNWYQRQSDTDPYLIEALRRAGKL